MPLYVEPAAGPAPIIRFFQELRGPAIVNEYIMTSRPVLAAAAAAARRGDNISVILDMQPYGFSAAKVAQEVDKLRHAGLVVVPPPARFDQRYRFDHAKYMVSRDEAVIMTANLDWSAFHKNREYLYVTRNPAIVAALAAIGYRDARQDSTSITVSMPNQLVISPGSAPAMRGVLSQSGPIGIETEEVQPGAPLLRTIARKGADAHLILPAKLTRREYKAVSYLLQHHVQVRLLKSPYMHAKMIVGNYDAFIGSQNFSQTSLTKNREIGIVLSAPQQRQILSQQFAADWARARPAE